MVSSPVSSATARVPFLVPPFGRPRKAGPDRAWLVRRRLNTKRTQTTLHRLAGEMSVAKRLTDITLSAVALIVLSPLLFAVAVLIQFTDFGPVLYWQQRVGRRGRTFWFPKFRSMMPGADRLTRLLAGHNDHARRLDPSAGSAAAGNHDVTFKMKRDPRVTWIGRIIRKFSIDELPQLWCVFKGDMSLVGPRPPLPSEVKRYTPYDRRRLDVTPGLTCIWQVSGRGDVPFPQQVEMDIAYIQTQSFWLDIKLMALTIPAVVRGRGAY